MGTTSGRPSRRTFPVRVPTDAHARHSSLVISLTRSP